MLKTETATAAVDADTLEALKKSIEEKLSELTGEQSMSYFRIGWID